MKGKARISFAAAAVADLEDILRFYAEQQVPHVGQRLVAEIVAKIEHLADYPDMGRVVPEFGLEYLREVILPPFRIIYRHDGGRVRIVRIWRSERKLGLP